MGTTNFDAIKSVELDAAALKIAGAAINATAAELNKCTGIRATAYQNVVESRTFVEAGVGTYTATVVIPAGGIVLDVIWRNTVLWTNGTSASLTVGDDDDDNGYIEATNVKAAPSADTNGAGAGISTRLSLGATAGVYKGGAGKYCAAQKTITAVVAVGTGSQTAGRSILTVEYAVPTAVAAVKS